MQNSCINPIFCAICLNNPEIMITYEEFASAASELQTLVLDWKWIDATNSHLPNSLVSP